MRRHLTCSIALASVLATSPLPVLAQDAHPAAPLPQKPAAEGLGGLYGTRNLSQFHAQATMEALQAEIGNRTRVPQSLADYQTFDQTSDLAALLDTAAAGNSSTLPLFVLLNWNKIALDLTSLDHTTTGRSVAFPPSPSPLPIYPITYGEQFGPARSSRAMAMVHLAMFEAANLLAPSFASYQPPTSAMTISQMSGIVPNPATDTSPVTMAQAISRAAQQTLEALYPHKQGYVEASFLRISVSIDAANRLSAGGSDALTLLDRGDTVGMAVANAILALRTNDGSDLTDVTNWCTGKDNQPANTIQPVHLCLEGHFPTPFRPDAMGNTAPPMPASSTQYTEDPVSGAPEQLGLHWAQVNPFVVDPSRFVTLQGLSLGDGVKAFPLPAKGEPMFDDSVTKTAYGPMIPDPHCPGQTASKYGVQIFGQYSDEQPNPNVDFCKPATAPGRTAEQTIFANFWGYDATALLCAPPRLYNMVATAFYYQQAGKRPELMSAVEEGRYLALVNLAMADAAIVAWKAKWTYQFARPVTYLTREQQNGWRPLGQVNSNSGLASTTPPFPAYPSGHATFGGALFQTIARFVGKDKNSPDTAFSFMSDEYNGKTFGLDGVLRPAYIAHFPSLSAAEWENAESRIWLGVHFQRDADDGVAVGNAIADKIFETTFKPLQKPS